MITYHDKKMNLKIIKALDYERNINIVWIIMNLIYIWKFDTKSKKYSCIACLNLASDNSFPNNFFDINCCLFTYCDISPFIFNPLKIT